VGRAHQRRSGKLVCVSGITMAMLATPIRHIEQAKKTPREGRIKGLESPVP
jgi:hypothetical protein